MSEAELDEILTFYWPLVLKRAAAGEFDTWTKRFVLSVRRRGKCLSWSPSVSQERVMRALVSDLGRQSVSTTQAIEE